MKFSSPEYPSYNSRNSKNNNKSNVNYTPKVKTPNYTTPVYSGPQTSAYSTASANSRTEAVYNSKSSNPSKPPNTFVPINRSVPAVPTNNQLPRNPSSYNNWDNSNTPDNMYDMYNSNSANYNGPVGVPLMPLYGYDNYEDAEKDCGYFRQLHPNTAQRIMGEIDDECDKLEYDGSAMFDEYPDRVRLGRIVDRIYEKLKDEIEEPIVYSESIKPDSGNEEIETLQYQRDGRRGNRRPPVRSNNWLRDLIEILLYQELQNRRRRYRSRRRWF